MSRFPLHPRQRLGNASLSPCPAHSYGANRMHRKLLSLVILVLAYATIGHAQSALPPASVHGVKLTWTAASQGSDTNPIVGYNIWRCTGTCTATGTGWIQLNTTPDAGTSYHDPAAGLSTSTTYSYVVYTQDSIGNTSGPSNVATVAIPSSFPSNPSAPSAPTATVE